MVKQQWIVRQGKSGNFTYLREGLPIKDKQQLERLRALRVPPAWREVTIAVSPRAKIQAQGIDSAGRLQYQYNPAFRARQEQAKFERTMRFARALPKMRATVEKHLQHPTLDKEKVLATIIKLMDEAYLRVGNETYAREHQHYGITTLRSKHTTVKGDTVIFDFIGKSGQPHHKEITDRRLARIIKRLDEMPGYEIFRYYDEAGDIHDIHSQDVNTYIKEVMGEEFSAKDFRTWAGTLLAAGELAAAAKVEKPRERKKIITGCVKKVAQQLGNTPAIARSSYIDPRIFNIYLQGEEIHSVWSATKAIQRQKYMRPEEACVMKLLES